MASKAAIIVLLLVAAVISQAAVVKRETTENRPEAPEDLPDCFEPEKDRGNCGFDVLNRDIYKDFLDEVAAWEKKNPTLAEEYNKANLDAKKKEQEKLEELEKYVKIQEESE